MIRIFSLLLSAIIILTAAAGCSDTDMTGQTDDLTDAEPEALSAEEPFEPAETAAVPDERVPVELGEHKVNEIGEQSRAETVAYLDFEETTEFALTSPETTTLPAETTTTAVPVDPPTVQPAVIAGINNETILRYDTICDLLRPASGKNVYIFNFSKAISSGLGIDGTLLPTEAEYGVKAAVNNKKITFTVYDHTSARSIVSIYVQALDSGSDNEKVYIENSTLFTVDTSSFTNGLYRAAVKFNSGNKAAIYFYVNGSETWVCETEVTTEKNKEIQAERRVGLMSVLKNGNVTPENSLSLDKVWYPYKVVYEYERCDTQLWIDLSKTFIDDSWSDEHKLYAIQAWIRENIAYDNFVRDNRHSRAVHYNDLTGKQSVYDLRAGVCFDYVNIIAIICRAHGIPAITIGSQSMNHVWNLVYVNDRWIEYDACMSEQYHVGEDVTVRTRTGDPLYGGIFSLIIYNTDTGRLPDDALANQYFQQDSMYLY